ncbi:MAG: hypothetical protein M3548_01725 [Actinomycetota bacterium]|nr:hypothetical protein [Actinomycetota bacterium]
MAVTGPQSTRRTLDFSLDRAPATVAKPIVRPRRPPRRRAVGERLMLAAERAFGGWAPTLRHVLLMVAGGLGTLVLVAVLAGPLPTFLGALVLATLIVTRRR